MTSRPDSGRKGERCEGETFTRFGSCAARHAAIRLRGARHAPTSYPAQLLGADAVADPLIADARSWAAKLSSTNEARRRSVAFIAGYQERLAGLARMRVPCLVIAFELDADTFAARAREVAAAIPGCRYVELPDAGHLTPVLDPQSVIDHVLAFFTEIDHGRREALSRQR